jgi:mono/diheme cytochrome c family protein
VKSVPLAAVAAFSLCVLADHRVGAIRPAQASNSPSAERQLISQYCIRCHNPRTKSGGVALDTADLENVAADTQLWEHAVRKLRARAMPPAGAPRPGEADYDRLVAYLETALDREAAARPNPGRPDAIRRLNRTEYRHAIRDILGLDVDVTELLPADEASFGFDNVSIAGLSPTLMERYLVAAQKISRLAVGSTSRAATSRVVLIPPDLTQEEHVDGLPLGTRGGTAFEHFFPLDGEYQIQVKLSRNRNENVEGLSEPHQMEILLDGARLNQFTIAPNRNRLGQYYADEDVDKGLEVRAPVTAGPHTVTATFVRKNAALIETTQQPYQAHFNADRQPRVQPAVHSVAIAGPFGQTAVGETPSRRRIFVCHDETATCAKQIVSTLARRAYRRPVGDTDVAKPLSFFQDASREGGFESGIETALRALLASPDFLFRVEQGVKPTAPANGSSSLQRVSDIDLASRLSFFLWSSVPDDELLDVAARGKLGEPAVLERQVVRMLRDGRAAALVTNFADQWLQLRNLTAAAPDPRMFPDFDQNLRDAMRRETELLFESVVREDKSVVDLLNANYTFLNERLARHYGIPNVVGDNFRRVELPAGSPRAGLLGQGSILTLTSYATRTSPVRRGKWILETIVGMPPPPPPPNVPELQDTRTAGHAPTMRERMVQHRADPACAACHQLMDPPGLSMEHFDAIGRWRARGDGGTTIDASGSLFGAAAFDGVNGLRQTLLARPDVFVGTLTEKLLTYGLGRGLEYYDAPAVRQIRRSAAAHNYRFSTLVAGVVKSLPFQMTQDRN